MLLWDGFACREFRVLDVRDRAVCILARELAVGAINVDEGLLELPTASLAMLLLVPGPAILLDPLCR